jgi:competence protein ComEA
MNPPTRRALVASLLTAAWLVSAAAAADTINLNTATADELKKLPEMNDARATAIVNYRKSTGDFIQVDELELIPQVKPIFGKIKDRVAVE